ncbi:MAG: low molecular weight phosphotyrosine protein phosphatase, partial [Bifidobacteriaceae bacterium]|nr:low molecular weight phosphotyrosine protein phosphatase [Bifidobacteriaceae bacterium]
MTVCTGNICRSPMGEIVLRAFFQQEGLQDDVRVISSGVSSEEQGNPIDRRAVKVLRDRGYEIPSNHYAHLVTPEEIKETDLFL